ncbi:hypothetical protein GUITHDRAFT_154529 [Guillardia theta CCMP2712]|uniref:Uncharacterized protein n=2 Tax=Guillardia theta TaxID=55529 RepID=L1IRR1_GUITC|nr:hypothetical protein GUITHDRAFT_154529 [Guillardia theta CCMP2712]EKX38956.1 hypothetical protein GUITHDRAFT_154529 [Guillardia theta CCMP2712]|mmetsp:Transcript_7372/g.25260  ORF Transcript_7372/g.25260 Transcript_7372/m.25260 type:complete len:155 (+) Transcript_7372:380-844(+)|eukprot:XP_005825936.1 hypothetical protein GUITHDRAFT_154529 [Guillardia theta CCMP2712]
MNKIGSNSMDSLLMAEHAALLKQKLHGEIAALQAQRHALMWGAVSYIVVFSIFLIVFSLRNRKPQEGKAYKMKSMNGKAVQPMRKVRSFSESFNTKMRSANNSWMVANKASSGSRFYANQINAMRCHSFDRRPSETSPEYSRCLTVRPFKPMHA